MAKKPPKNSAQEVVDLIRKKFGAAAAVVPGVEDPASEIREWVPTGIDVLDRYVLGGKGLPAGRASELFGEEGSGKSSAVEQILATTLAAGGVGAYVDSERSFDSSRAGVFGLSAERLRGLVLTQPWTLEEAMEHVLYIVPVLGKSNGPRVVVWDSVAGAPFKGDLDGQFDKARADDRAYKIGKFCRALGPLLVEHQVHFMAVNQLREKRGIMFGNNATTPGGKPLKFLASVRLQLFSGKSIKDNLGQHVGKAVTFAAVKNRLGPPWRKAKVRLDYARGWDNLWSTITLAKELGLIPKGEKVGKATYQKAVAVLNWEGAADVEETASSGGDEVHAVGDVVDGEVLMDELAVEEGEL